MKHSRTLLVIFIILAAFGIGAVNAQDPFVVGYLRIFGAGYQAFVDEMTSLGYVEGVDITYMSVSYEGFDQTTPMEAYIEAYNTQVQAMVDLPVDLFVANTDTDAVALQALTGGTIPTVFAVADDPVATGAVADLINPGGVMTGAVTNRPHERRLQILTEMLPATDKIYYLYSPLTGEAEVVLGQVRAVAAELGVEVVAAPIVDGPTGVEALLNTPEGVDWLFLTPFVPFDVAFYQALSETSLSRQIGVAAVTDDPNQCCLIGYGPNIDDTSRQSARIVDRILRGANPAELPVETIENFLMVNLEAAETIGMEIPVGILRQANLIVRPGYFEALATPVAGG